LTYAGYQVDRTGLEKPGKTKGGLATAMGVRPGAVSEILSGIRLIKASEIAPIIEYLELNSVPIMGRVGAGASIEPEHEQVPPEGLGEVELPFPIAEETIAFEVAGDSMLPKYENGDIIVGLSRTAPSAVELLRRGSRRTPEDRRALSENDRARKISDLGQPHELQCQADHGRKAGMDRGDLRHPAPGPDRAVAQQGGGPGTQGDKVGRQSHAGQIAIEVTISESADSIDARECLAARPPQFLFFRIFT
jgi:hypothetical protein